MHIPRDGSKAGDFEISLNNMLVIIQRGDAFAALPVTHTQAEGGGVTGLI